MALHSLAASRPSVQRIGILYHVVLKEELDGWMDGWMDGSIAILRPF